MNETFTWYATQLKPDWAPPSWLFGPVWTVLYIIIGISFGYVFYEVARGKLSWMIAVPLILNLIFNFAFSPIQFGLKNNLLAAVDISLVLVTLIWSLVSVFPYARWVSLANLPYLAWVCFATVLQFTVTYLNRL